MNGSFNFFFHLLAFGMVVGAFVTNFILDRKLRAEQDWGRKMYIGGIMRTFGMFTPYIAAVLILTGIGNIYNRFLGSPYPWYDEGWLVAKLICFVVLVSNALILIPRVGMSRMMLIKSIAEKNAPSDAEQQLAKKNRTVSIIFLVQATLLLTIVYLSAFGDGKHPGQF